MSGIAKVGTHLHQRLELAGERPRYCEVEVAKRALSDWVVVVRRGTVGGRGKPKARVQKFYAGINAMDQGKRELAHVRSQGYRPVRNPKSSDATLVKKQTKKPETLVTGVPLVERCINELGRRKKRGAPGGDVARLAKVRLVSRTKLPPSVSRYLAFDARMSRLPGAVWKGGLVIDRNYHPIAVEPKVAVTELLRQRYGTKALSRQLRDLNEKAVRNAASLLDTRLLGKLFRLPSPGEQHHFLYAGKPDADGELPVVGMELESFITDAGAVAAEIAVFLKYPSFDWMVADLTDLLDPALESATTRRALATAMKATRRRHPELRDQALFDR